MANVFDPTVKREKIHWMQGRKEKHTIDAWNKVGTIGTRVLYHDKVHVVQSHPGLNVKAEACVFISDVVEPVPLRLLYLAEDAGNAQAIQEEEGQLHREVPVVQGPDLYAGALPDVLPTPPAAS